MSGVFDGVRVVDLSSGVAGAMTTMMLADMGADVLRIEPPGLEASAEPSGYRVWNRGKRRASADLDSTEGRAMTVALAERADVVVHNWNEDDASSRGVDHATLSVINPGVITCSITGYGTHPAHLDRVADDALVAARTGLLFDQKGRRGTAMEFINGRPGPLEDFEAEVRIVRGADRPGPVFPRSPWPSIGATHFATLGIAAALRAREHTGRGQRVETSLLRGALASVCLNWQRVEDPDAPLYWMWPIDSRSVEGLYECADGRWVHHWTIRPNWVLQTAAGDEMANVDLDGAYRDDPDRISMEADGMLTGLFLHPSLAEAFKKFPARDWVDAGAAAEMGVALVRTPAEALNDANFLADGCVVQVEDPEIGPIRHCGPLVEFSRTPPPATRPRPLAGADTAAARREANEPVPEHGRALTGSLPHALAGVRVIDLGLGVAGPFAGRVLADLGAEVIKVHALHDTYWAGTHMGLGTNRGKRSIALNLKHPAGRAALDRLIDGADVVTTNWRPGAAARLGLDCATLSARNPRLVYCNSRGYEKGERAMLPGTDQTAAALVGSEWEDGACDAGNPPMWSRSNMGDTGNAMLSAVAITAALYHRDRTGEGQEVGTSIVNAGLLHTSYAWVHEDGRPGDWGHVDAGQFGLGPWYRLYACAEGSWLFVAAFTPEQRAQVLRIIDEAGLDADDASKVSEILEARFRERDAGAWLALLDTGEVPAEVVDEQFCRTLFDDPEARADALIAQTWADAVGSFEDPGLLVTLSDTPGIVQRGPSMCGEHSRELLLECGYTAAEIDALVADRAVLDAPVTQP